MVKKKTVCLVMCLCVLLQTLQPVSVRAEETQAGKQEESMEEFTEEGVEEITEESTEKIVEEVAEESTEETPDSSLEDSTVIITEEIPSSSVEDNIAVITEETSDEVIEIAESYTHTDENGNVFAYTLDENSQALIHEITLSGAALTVPAELDGYVVALVGNENASVVTNLEVYIPEFTVSCASVEPNAFKGLSIGTLTMDERISSMSGYVITGTGHIWKQFGDCTIEHLNYNASNMQAVIPWAVASPPETYGIFAGSQIGSVSFGENVESIVPFLFCGATMQMDELSINVPKIGARAFCGKNIQIGTLVLNENVSLLGESPYSSTTYHYYEQFAGAKIDHVILNSSSMELEHTLLPAASVTLRGPFYESEIGGLAIGNNVGTFTELLFGNARMNLDTLEIHVPEIGAFAFAGTGISIGNLVIGSEVETFAESYFSTSSNHRYSHFQNATIEKVDYQAVSAEISHVAANASTDSIFGMFHAAQIGDLKIDDGVETIPEYLFNNAKMNLESLTIEAREIGANAFSGANISVGILTIGQNVEVFPESYFSTTVAHEYQQFAASNIGKLYYDASAAYLSHTTGVSSLTGIYGIFQKADIGELYIGENVEIIPEYLFDSAVMELDSITINANEIGANAFAGASISIGTLTIGPDVEIFTESYISTVSSHNYKQFAAATIGKVNYEAVKAELTHTAAKGASYNVYGMFWKAEIGEVAIGENVEVIPEYLFDMAEMSLEELHLNVKEVGASAFYGSNISIGILTIGENVEEFSESYYSTVSSHKYQQFAYANIGTVYLNSKALILSNDAASISSTSSVNAPFKSCAIGMLYISDGVTDIPRYIFRDAEMTLDELIITAESVGTYAFYGSGISIGKLTIEENVGAFLTDPSGKSYAFAYNDIATLNYNAVAAGMDSPKTGTYGPFYSADIAALNVGENVSFLDSYFFRGDTFANSSIFALTANDSHKEQKLSDSYLPISSNLSVHYNSDFKEYFNYDAENISWMCMDYLIEDGYGDVIYDEATGTYNMEVFKHCSVCGYSVTELEEADTSYDLYLSIPLGISLHLNTENLSYTGNDVIYAYGSLGNVYDGITISVDTVAQDFGIAQKGEDAVDISDYFSAYISGSAEYIISADTLSENAQFIADGSNGNLHTREIEVCVDAVELLKHGIGKYEFTIPFTVELNTVTGEETAE